MDRRQTAIRVCPFSPPGPLVYRTPRGPLSPPLPCRPREEGRHTEGQPPLPSEGDGPPPVVSQSRAAAGEARSSSDSSSPGTAPGPEACTEGNLPDRSGGGREGCRDKPEPRKPHGTLKQFPLAFESGSSTPIARLTQGSSAKSTQITARRLRHALRPCSGARRC